MEKVLTDLCHELNNYFWRQKIQGNFTIENGTLTCSFLKQNQYFRIVGSVFNDGVHKYPPTGLTNEEFEGAIWSMAVPQAVIDLATDIAAWQALYGGVDSSAMSPFTSENFGNYGYSKSGASSGSGSSSGNPNCWQAAFATRLNRYRRLRGMP